MMRGKLVVFEGLDRSGKSTQCARLVERLKAEGHSVEALRFPDRTTPIGKLINGYLAEGVDQDDHAIHLLFSANRWEAVEKIRSLLHEETTIVIDRWYYSGIAYTAAKQKPNLSASWARNPDVGLPRPDICIFLDLSRKARETRKGFGEERYERSDLQERVREAFTPLLQDAEVEKVDAGADVDSVHDAIWKLVTDKFEQVDRDGSPLQTLK